MAYPNDILGLLQQWRDTINTGNASTAKYTNDEYGVLTNIRDLLNTGNASTSQYPASTSGILQNIRNLLNTGNASTASYPVGRYGLWQAIRDFGNTVSASTTGYPASVYGIVQSIVAIALLGGASGALPTFAFETETTAIITAMTAASATPSANRQYFINKTVKRLKACGAWAIAAAAPTRSRLYLLSTDVAGAALINWFNPGTGNATLQGSPTFTSKQGYSATANTNYIKTGLTLQTLSQNDAHVALWTNTFNSSISLSDIGATDGVIGATLSTYHQSSTSAVARLNGPVATAPSGTFYTGGANHVAVDRSVSTGVNFIRNGYVRSTNVLAASSAYVANTEIVICGSNGNGTIVAGSGRIIRAALICPSLAALTATQTLEVYAAIQAYANGVQYGEPELHDAGYQPAVVTADAIFLGCTPASICGAYKHSRDGHSPIIVGGERDRSVDQLGGTPANGLQYMDSADFTAIGGIPKALTTLLNGLISRVDANTQTANNFQNKIFNFGVRQILDVNRTGGTLPGAAVPIYFAGRVASVTYSSGTGLYTVITSDGRTFKAPNFHDNTYSQESFDAMGVPYTSGGEVTGSAEEANNGYLGATAFSLPKKTGGSNLRIDPYVTPATPASGYLPNVVDPPSITIGQPDPATQAMVFRLSLTTDVFNSVPWDTTPPTNYDAMNYEALGRIFALESTLPFTDLFVFHAVSPSGTVYDFNTGNPIGYFSLDVIGSGTAWVAAQTSTQAARETVYKDAENRIRGLWYWLLSSGDARIPSAIKTAAQTYFLLADQNLDPHPNDRVGWDACIYTRQCRRLQNSSFVLNGNDFGPPGGTPKSVKTIACASYAFDAHGNRLVAYDDGSGKTVWQQGGFSVIDPVNGKTKTPVPIECIITDPTFANGPGFSTATGPSSTLVAFSALRMEPTMMGIGVAQGAMSSLRIETPGTDYRTLTYSTLRTKMLDGVDAVALQLPVLN